MRSNVDNFFNWYEKISEIGPGETRESREIGPNGDISSHNVPFEYPSMRVFPRGTVFARNKKNFSKI
jgi:hypothetical protein